VRIILDSNLWISFLISSRFERLDSLLETDRCRLLFSRQLLEEFVGVARRPKLQKYISKDELDDLLETIDEVADFVSVHSSVTLCRDPKDNFLLELAIDGNADYLLTGDKDLLVLKQIEGTQIMKIAAFMEQVIAN
jgi:putative PIN family toxin of toxin-antitoxin system